jgi:FixJ family two-component response regulator
MVAAQTLISIVDDDESVREALGGLLEECGFVVRTFSSAEEYLASNCIADTRCLFLDVAMPRMTGPELQLRLRQQRTAPPVVFITGHGDAMVRPRLLAQGAVECLFKPLGETAVLAALEVAVQKGVEHDASGADRIHRR